MSENDEELKQARDDIRCEAALQTLKDVLWRFEEASEGGRSVYDVLSYLLEDLLREGVCPACMNEMFAATFTSAGADPTQHREDDGEVFH
jgi:hypothetical protein